MIHIRTYPFILLFLLTACTTGTETSATTNEWPATQLVCEPLPDTTGNRYTVYAEVGDSRVRLLDWGSCTNQLPEFEKTVVDTALSILRGQFRGWPTLVYAFRIPNGGIQFQLTQKRQEKVVSVPVAKLRAGQFQFQHPLGPIDLQGTYIRNTPDSTFVLLLRGKKQSLQGELFRKAGPAPDYLDAYELAHRFRVDRLSSLKVDYVQKTLQTKWGTGLIDWTPESCSINWPTFPGQAGEVTFVRKRD